MGPEIYYQCKKPSDMKKDFRMLIPKVAPGSGPIRTRKVYTLDATKLKGNIDFIIGMCYLHKEPFLYSLTVGHHILFISSKSMEKAQFGGNYVTLP